MFEMLLDVWDVECSGCGMFGMWDVRDVGCWGCGIFRMWDFRDMLLLCYFSLLSSFIIPSITNLHGSKCK